MRVGEYLDKSNAARFALPASIPQSCLLHFCFSALLRHSLVTLRMPAIWNARINVGAIASSCNVLELRQFCNHIHDVLAKSLQAQQQRLTNQELTIVQNMQQYTWRDWCNGRGFMGPNCHMP
ncbi:unnamed protein product [Cylicocyclus nassatus]|uniref:Uncharacterized protein n=1 Tax=Cylicocyclus nassatus TaxID=53992 RepID=A0AA36HC15_CYLNA|nr:unnamed protein product [Cylicocyclus nassatus]